MILRRGDTVGVVSPGFAVRPAALRSGVRALEAMGFRVRLGAHALDRAGYFAGDDAARADDLAAMLGDDDVAAVWLSRGGYGCARLLTASARRRLRSAPKLLVGYSDATALFCAALRGARAARCVHGPVVSELGRAEAFDTASLRRALSGGVEELKLSAGSVLRPGRGAGRLVGGNLSVLASLVGTPHFPDLRGAVLLVEEVGEPLYRVDRMLWQLRASGALRGLRGVLAGEIGIVPRRRFPPDRELRAVLEEAFADPRVPVVVGLPVGHVAGKRSLRLGGRATIDTAARRVRVEP